MLARVVVCNVPCVLYQVYIVWGWGSVVGGQKLPFPPSQARAEKPTSPRIPTRHTSANPCCPVVLASPPWAAVAAHRGVFMHWTSMGGHCARAPCSRGRRWAGEGGGGGVWGGGGGGPPAQKTVGGGGPMKQGCRPPQTPPRWAPGGAARRATPCLAALIAGEGSPPPPPGAQPRWCLLGWP